MNEFFGEKVVKDKVEKLWGNVMESARKFIRDSHTFGFEKVGIVPNPTVHQMLSSLRLADVAFGMIMADAEDSHLDADDIRLIFNAKQQILNMERVATALNNKDRFNYDEAVRLLENQATF